MEIKEISTYKTAIEKWGVALQLDMVIEEMSELTKEICKIKRGRGSLSDTIDEIADVSIMLEQLIVMMDNGMFPDYKYMINHNKISHAISEQKEYKINRLKKMLSGESATKSLEEQV